MELGIGLTKIIPPVVYIVGISVIFFTLFYKIEVGLFFTIPLLTQQSMLDHMTRYPGGKDFMDFLFLALIIKSLLNRQNLKLNLQWKKPVYIIIIAIIAWTYFELWFGSFNLGLKAPISIGDPRFVKWKNFVMLPILYLIVVHNVKEIKQIKVILILMSFTMLFMDRSFYHNFSGREHSTYRNDIRVGSTFSYLGPNETAVFYAQNTIIILCIFLLDSNTRRRFLFGITTIFNYYALLFLYSRGGYLAALASLMFLGLIKNRKLLLMLIVFLIFWRTFVPFSVQQRIDMTKTEEGTDHSVTARYEMWEEAINFFRQNPIIGTGYATIPFLNITTDETHYRKTLHNGHLELLVELGLVGVIIFIIFYSIGIRYGWCLYRSAKDPFLKGLGLGFAGCVIAVLAGNIAGSYLFYFNVSGFYWVYLALIVRGLEISKSNESTIDTPKPRTNFRSLKTQIKHKAPLPIRS